MVFKLVDAAQKPGEGLMATTSCPSFIQGVRITDGLDVVDKPASRTVVA
jgi:hypothetical protein